MLSLQRREHALKEAVRRPPLVEPANATQVDDSTRFDGPSEPHRGTRYMSSKCFSTRIHGFHAGWGAAMARRASGAQGS